MQKVKLFWILIFASSLFAQKIIENPENPKQKNTDRILELNEIMRISDEPGRFYFQNPCNLNIGINNEIFLQDNKQLLMFDSEGKFLCNFFHLGKGPGEMEKMSNFQVFEDKIMVHANPPKILHFSYDGKLLKEILIHASKWFANFLFFYKGQYYFLEPDWTKLEGHEKIVEIPKQLISLAEGCESYRHLMDFGVRYFFAQHAGERAIIQVDKIVTCVWKNKYLTVSHTPEYLVKIFNADTGNLDWSLSREYQSLKAPKTNLEEQPRISMGGKIYTQPPKKYQDDIVDLVAADDNLWVITSASNSNEGLAVDVFDLSGIFLDRFKLKFSGGIPVKIFERYPMIVKENNIYVILKGENDILHLGKYEIKNKLNLKTVY